MKFPKLSLIAGAAIAALVFSGCSILDDIEEEDEITIAPVAPKSFRVLATAGELNILAAADGDKSTEKELNGVFDLYGTCLSVTDTEEGILLVVWPSDTLALQHKPGLEFAAMDWEGDPVRARFNLGDPIVVAGSFVTDASWFTQIPEECGIPDVGVFVISNAHHPAPVEEEPATDPEEETENVDS